MNALSSLNRYALLQGTIAAAGIGAWMAPGWLLAIPTNDYLLLGVPLVLAYQRFVARRPMRALWRFDGAPLAFDRKMFGLGAILAALPGTLPFVERAATGKAGLEDAAWCACSAVGALGLAWWLVNAWRRRDFWRGRRQPTFFALTVATGVLLFSLLAWSVGAHPTMRPLNMLAGFVSRAWLYACVCFVLEEVVFRGAIDPAIAPDAPVRGVRAHATAVFVSLLWGAWHFPMIAVGHGSSRDMLPTLGVHVAVGWPMTMLARRARNLGPTCIAHATIDAFRDLVFAP